MIQKDSDNAIAMAKKSVRLSHDNFSSLMVLAQIYMATARFDEMRDTARKAAQKAPSAAVKEQIVQMFKLTDEEDKDPDNISDDTETPADDSETDSDSNNVPGLPSHENFKLNLGGGNNQGRPSLGGGLKLNLNN
jgi:hypothetical protein